MTARAITTNTDIMAQLSARWVTAVPWTAESPEMADDEPKADTVPWYVPSGIMRSVTVPSPEVEA
jgi:hypothetical protein